jgi:hypothetical protein
MLTKNHIENFNDQHMRIYIPAFAQDSPDFDKIWLVFLWMVGQNYGFKNAYHFHHADYKLLTGTAQGRASDDLCHEFNQRHGKWIKLAFVSNYWNVAYFQNTDWEFVPYDLKDARMQRALVHLYNAVWAGGDLSSHLFQTVKEASIKVVRNKSADTGWYHSNNTFSGRPSGWNYQDDDHPPHYLAQQWTTYGEGQVFSGAIVPEKIISNE